MGKLPCRNVIFHYVYYECGLYSKPVLRAAVAPLKADFMTTHSHCINSHKLLFQRVCSLHYCDAIGSGYR